VPFGGGGSGAWVSGVGAGVGGVAGGGGGGRRGGVGGGGGGLGEWGWAGIASRSQGASRLGKHAHAKEAASLLKSLDSVFCPDFLGKPWADRPEGDDSTCSQENKKSGCSQKLGRRQQVKHALRELEATRFSGLLAGTLDPTTSKHHSSHQGELAPFLDWAENILSALRVPVNGKFTSSEHFRRPRIPWRTGGTARFRLAKIATSQP